MAQRLPFSIAKLGIAQALQVLVPFVRSAGRLAVALQPHITAQEAKTEKGGGSRFSSALTDADLLLEDRFGSDLFMLFSDASFWGEEHETDRISRYMPKDNPYVITLDPINSTLYYRDGLPIYETIVTICDRAWKMLGAIVYRPAFDEVYCAYSDATGRRATLTIYRDDSCHSMKELTLNERGGERVVYLDKSYGDKAGIVRRGGYTPIFPWRDYAGEKNWPHASCGVLTGKSRGVLVPGGQLIDCKAFGFIAACAGGIWTEGAFDPATLKYTYGLSAADKKTAALLESLL